MRAGILRTLRRYASAVAPCMPGGVVFGRVGGSAGRSSIRSSSRMVGGGHGSEPQPQRGQDGVEHRRCGAGQPEVAAQGGDEQHGRERDDQHRDEQGGSPSVEGGVQAAKNRVGGTRNRMRANEATQTKVDSPVWLAIVAEAVLKSASV